METGRQTPNSQTRDVGTCILRQIQSECQTGCRRCYERWDSVKAIGAQLHCIQHTWTLRSGRSLVMISPTRLNFHKFSPNASMNTWSQGEDGLNGEFPVWEEKSHGCLGSSHGVRQARALWKQWFPEQRDSYTRCGWGFLICSMTVILTLHPLVSPRPPSMSSSHPPVQSPLPPWRGTQPRTGVRRVCRSKVGSAVHTVHLSLWA